MRSMQMRSSQRRLGTTAQGELFNPYEIRLGDADHSNLVSIYDALPRFSWASKTVRDMSQMTTQLEGSLNGQPFRVIMKAVSMELPVKVKGKATGQMEWVGLYPGSREECVEEALRKFSTQPGRFNEAECSVRFSLYDLRKELKSVGHTYTYDELRQALDILAKSSLTIQTRAANGDKIDITSNYLPLLYLRSKNKNSKDYIEVKDISDADKGDATLCMAVLHPLISRGIECGDFRLYHYATSMRLTNSLAKILNRELSMGWRNASPAHPYRFHLVEFLSNTARGLSKRMPEDFRAVNIALAELVKEEVLSSFKSTPIKKLKGKGAIDYVYEVLPTNKFVSMIIEGHRREKSRELALSA
ncbi:replication protein (plasmid) [Pseudomonas fulva]|uniref:Replication protein n=2 Tax=Pseudomonas putida group TaxID=136845 RepID=A0A1X1A1D8_PSEPU|nr:replication protein [Pseudomonas putida]MCT8162821.1 replication protein [Pseudomonas sp. HD6422]MCT8181410.1 replication protein [Pseudomonas sp. HD6421]MDM1712471.1 replication protein [Pseudomonas sp. 165]PLP92299.1 replication protein [Pseudomonas sp. FFUP_PS_41]QPH47031.1 replication protein [Pseudomonas fulva]